jgi:hypothetical protein
MDNSGSGHTVRRRSTRRLSATLVAALAVLALAGGMVSAARATTQPSPYTVIRVFITDGQIRLSKPRATGVTYVLFYVLNQGKLPHNLVIGIQRTRVLKPGQRTQIPVAFLDPGIYYLKSTVNPTSHKGKLLVTFPSRPD